MIDSAAERKRRARAAVHIDTICLFRPTVFARVQYFIQIPPPPPPHNVCLSESKDMCLSFYQKKMETYLGRFWEIPGNVWKFELSKILIREVLQNEFWYDFRKCPREISAGMEITVLKAIMHVNTVNTVPAEISRGPFRKSYRNFAKPPYYHKNALVFHQTFSGKFSWSFSYRWTQYQ